MLLLLSLLFPVVLLAGLVIMEKVERRLHAGHGRRPVLVVRFPSQRGERRIPATVPGVTGRRPRRAPATERPDTRV